MKPYTRYALYFAPEPGPLAEFAAHWLGWDAASGTPREHPHVDGLPAPISDLTITPRKYGFHGTLKPPFRLARGTDRAGLEAAVADLASRLPATTLEGLSVTPLGRFLALTPDGDASGLAQIANACVRDLDAFRAPASEAELERRRASGLTPRQDSNLLAWGYPYVFEDFRFHMTLTGKIPKAQVAPTAEALTSAFTPLLSRPFPITSICLFGERQDGLFEIVHRYALTG
ncbi:DUF1045 domain-containing protein [Pseudoprimorskyibacter insulae]|uniref:Phosphonate metabolism protein n=1 Tax=Pseudoprimorskyibacter insulae TaxID=1695997 RepID=A0A2R8ANK0_9RHOB|nr:DUF1045 domain-containing protein [Pseudoprimorskyibacter insulae]SPF77434.1 hypothetical protein PRI8871_00015 [Pseudoprimorskyibacter insulae]